MLPIGPRPISQKSQVVIPQEVMASLRLEPGDKVSFVLADELPGCAVIVPVEKVAEIWTAGWARVFAAGDNRPTPSEKA